MKIDEATINHNAMLLIKSNVSCLWEITDKENHDVHTAEILLGEIEGIVNMADAMKKCLKI